MVISEAAETTVLGWVEKARIYPGGLKIVAKMDTGADNSSLNVTKWEKISRGGKDWIRFTVRNESGEALEIERELLRMAKIKRHKGASHVRPVVKLGICIGNIYKEAQVNLYDRSRFKYNMLIGRSFMKGPILIDPSKKLNGEPYCKEAPKP